MPTMDEVMQSVRDTFTVQRVFGDPIERDGVALIPVAAVNGGAGGGGGTEGAGDGGGEGSGAGFGGGARPVGVYVVTADGVEWQPALDVTRLAMGGIALAALMVLTLRPLFRRG